MFRGDIKQKILTGKLGKTITTFVLTTNFPLAGCTIFCGPRFVPEENLW